MVPGGDEVPLGKGRLAGWESLVSGKALSRKARARPCRQAVQKANQGETLWEEEALC